MGGGENVIRAAVAVSDRQASIYRVKFDWPSLDWIHHGRASTAIWSRSGAGFPTRTVSGLVQFQSNWLQRVASESGQAGTGARPASPGAELECPDCFISSYTLHRSFLHHMSL